MNHTTKHAMRSTRTVARGGPAVPTRQLTWTRLGCSMGHTNTKAKRAAIRTAVERMAWQDPTELTAVLYAAPARQVIAVLLADRHPAVHKAAVAELPPGPFGQRRRLLAIEPVTGERWVLLDDCGYEWTHLYTDRPAPEQVVCRP